MMGAEGRSPMLVRWTRRTRMVRVSLSSGLVTGAMMAAALALGGCGHAAAKTPDSDAGKQCGTSRSAANVPVAVEIDRGSVSCTVAMTIEKAYAAAIDAGKAPGNGGGGPIVVSGWTCQGFDTPQVLKTGDASKCTKGGTEILALLSTPS
jgi:hypothetical protein